MKQKKVKRCVVCDKEYEGYDWRTTCGSEECKISNKNGIRPFAHNAGMGYLLDNNSELGAYKDNELLEELGRRGIGVEAKFFKTNLTYNVPVPKTELNKLKFAIVSDSHFGSKMQQRTYLEMFYDICVRENITTILHCGDLVEGNGKLYNGQLHEMFLFGTDNQEKYFIDYYPNREGITTYCIGGSHDYSFFKDSGHDVLTSITDKREDLINLGYTTAQVNLGDLSIRMRHPRGKPTKTRSGKLQNEIDNMSPESIPDILLVGHYHHMIYMAQHKGCECILLPCFQGRTTLLDEVGLNPTIGGIILTVWYDDEKNHLEIIPEFKLWKNEIKNDY